MYRNFARLCLPAALAVGLCAAASVAQEAVDSGAVSDTTGLDRTTVAVLPLEVAGDDPSAAELAAVVSETISRQIVAVDGLHVVDPARLLPLVDSGLGPDEVARTLGVGGVISGSLHARYGEWWADLRYHNVVSAGGGGGTSFAIVGDIATGAVFSDRILTMASTFAEMAEQIAFRVAQPSWPEARDAMRTKLLDTSLSDAESLEAAMLAICDVCGPMRTEALGGHVAESLAGIALQSPEPTIRLRAWLTLRQVSDPILIRPLLDSLAGDPDAQVRREAAARLVEGFLDEAGVRAAVERAAETDAAETVRDHVRFSLLSDEERTQHLWDVALDPSESDKERLMAINTIGYADGRFEELTHELVLATLQIGRRASHPYYRSWAWDLLADSRDPYLVDVYLEWLDAERSEELREVAVRGLGAFVDRADVRATLEDAAHDESVAVSMAAAESLRELPVSR